MKVCVPSPALIEALAAAIKTSTDRFALPVRHNIEGEASTRYKNGRKGLDALWYETPMSRDPLVDYKLIAVDALCDPNVVAALCEADAFQFPDDAGAASAKISKIGAIVGAPGTGN